MTELPHLTDRVRRALAHHANVTEKRMFGGIAFMVNGKMCVTVGDHVDHQMMVRIDPAAMQLALAKKGASAAKMRGRAIKGYVFLLEEAVTTKRDLDGWVRLALDYNATLTPRDRATRLTTRRAPSR